MSTDAPDPGSPSLMHYSGDHQPNQHNPGQHITPPVSHVDRGYEHDMHLDYFVHEAEKLRQTARFWRSDAAWPDLRYWLQWHEIQLVDALRQDPDSLVIQQYLRTVRNLLGPRIMARIRRFFHVG